jgi:hypothetical protein
MPAVRLTGADDAIDPEKLARLVGPVRSLSCTRLTTSGYSTAQHDRLEITLASGATRRLVVKRVPATDWTAHRTGEQLGREALLLGEPALAAVWEPIECPYLAYWSGDGEIGLVMDDLSPFLLPDVRAPLSEDQEERLLVALAELHAQFWSSPALDLPWLARAQHYAGFLDSPSASSDSLIGLPVALRERVRLGWAAASRHVPASIAAALARPAADVARDWITLPRTLLHGDVKVANFAIMPSRQVAAFDWAMLGTGPATVDVGWYLGVNASRLARPKDKLLARYRLLLTERLGSPLHETLWDSLSRVAVICGARMMLWSKALALEANGPGSRDEWKWWMEHLEAAIQ